MEELVGIRVWMGQLELGFERVGCRLMGVGTVIGELGLGV